MSSQGEQILPHPKYVDLVRKITEKTRRKKILWNKTPTGFSATVAGKVHFGFVRPLGWPLSGGKWSLFTIRDEEGNEILSVNNPATSLVLDAILSGVDPSLSTLRDAIGDLFDAVEEIGRAEVEKLIETIDKI